jgi:hypothetical protein
MEEAMQKRYEVRRSAIIPTEVMAPYWSEPMDLVAADISPRGMYLLSEDMPSVGEYLFCSFALQGEDPEYSFFSRVQRVNWHRRRTERYRPGFGVEFLDVNGQNRFIIRSALRGLPPPIPSRGRDKLFEAPKTRVNSQVGETVAYNWCEANRRLLALSAQPEIERASMGRPIIHQGIRFYC